MGDAMICKNCGKAIVRCDADFVHGMLCQFHGFRHEKGSHYCGSIPSMKATAEPEVSP